MKENKHTLQYFFFLVENNFSKLQNTNASYDSLIIYASKSVLSS